jgi:hypothetical protein
MPLVAAVVYNKAGGLDLLLSGVPGSGDCLQPFLPGRSIGKYLPTTLGNHVQLRSWKPLHVLRTNQMRDFDTRSQ